MINYLATWLYKFMLGNMEMFHKKTKLSDSNDIYKLQVYKYVKLHDTGQNSELEPRSGHRIECTDTCVYSIGGFNPNHQVNSRESLFCEVWKYNFISRAWIKLKVENLPEELASCSTTISGSLLFLYGGTGIPFGGKLNKSMYVCKLSKPDAKIKFEEMKPKNDSPRAQYGHSMVLIGSYLYTIGGTEGHTYSMDVHRFNIQFREWERLYNCNTDDGPAPRYRHEVIHFNNRLYVFGGGTSTVSYSLEDISAFNLKTNTWEVHRTSSDLSVPAGYPGNRKYHGCVQDPYNPSLVFINCGINTGDDAFKDTWRLDLHTLKWTCISSLSLPHGIYFHSVAVTPDGRMIVFGGITTKTQTPERTADLYTAWITIPKLVDACWDALIYYIHKGIIIPPKNFKSLGLPLKFEDRMKNSGLNV